VSGCFRAKQGAKVCARLQGVIAACRKQDRNVFAVLRTPFAHQPVTLLAGLGSYIKKAFFARKVKFR
jgi:hypothetical protein